MAVRVATEKSYGEHLKKLRGEIEKKHGKSVEQLYQERQKRLWDAIEMRQPDKVPVALGGNYLAARMDGLPYSALYYDPVAWKESYTKMMAEFEPDTPATVGGQSGSVLEILDAKTVRWPGGPFPPDITNQAIDGEYMKEDEYDIFLEDLTDFTLRYYLPRVYGTLEPLSKIPELSGRGAGLPSITPLFTTPEFQEVGRVLLEAGEEQKKWNQAMGKFDQDMESLGFPPMPQSSGGAGGIVFDQMANTYRGWKGVIADMYRRPEKLIAALEKLNRMQIAKAKPADLTKKGPQMVSSGPIHRGSDRFLSKKHWETFYWPTWKKTLQKSIDMGYKVYIFAEGFCENRFEYFLEFPKGSLVIRFTDTDMFKAKEALGDHFCLQGSVPLTMLQMASSQEVDEYCKKLIQVCGKGGGYILSPDTAYIQDAKPENVKAMMNAVEKYGWY